MPSALLFALTVLGAWAGFRDSPAAILESYAPMRPPSVELIDDLVTLHPRQARRDTLWMLASASDDDERRRESADCGSGILARGPGVPDVCFEQLELSLADPDTRVRSRAVSSLAMLGGDRAVELLASVLAEDEQPVVREEAVYALAELGGDVAARCIELALLDPAREVKEAAVEAAVDLGGDASAAALGFILNDEDPSLREEAVYALGEIGGEAAIDVLHGALSDEEAFVREAAAEVLADLSRDEK